MEFNHNADFKVRRFAPHPSSNVQCQYQPASCIITCLYICGLCTVRRCMYIVYIIRYRLHSRLGPVKIPSQKKILPTSLRPRIRRVRLSETSGSCDIWRINK